jgi:hypothetical protein
MVFEEFFAGPFDLVSDCGRLGNEEQIGQVRICLRFILKFAEESRNISGELYVYAGSIEDPKAKEKSSK